MNTKDKIIDMLEDCEDEKILKLIYEILIRISY